MGLTGNFRVRRGLRGKAPLQVEEEFNPFWSRSGELKQRWRAIVLDNGPIHISKATRAALAARAHWLTVEWLPKYAPELNDIELAWRDLKAHHLAHQTFADCQALERAIH